MNALGDGVAKTHIVMALAAALAVSACQTATIYSTEVKHPEQFQRVINGGLGIQFDDNIEKLKELGLVPKKYPRKQYEVGKWRTPLSKSEGFFNFGKEAVAGPISQKIFNINGYRVYGVQRYVSHFASCEEDFELLKTQIEQKYPSLHSSYKRYKLGEHRSVSFYEGKGRYQFSSDPRYFGRSISLTCSIQTSGDQVIGSMLFMNYSEDYETKKLLRAEQKQVFQKASSGRLNSKGLNSNEL
ncbi:MAG: hypothetical protein COB59_11010 [Rhodospirillaceae bacterium]|nr:MAG: hypothetical protein COB59_11010 [Rhodospirillaceae bacterium]